MKIIHLSDLHICKNLDNENEHIDLIFNYIVSAYAPFDTLIAVTGDIIDDGKDEQNIVAQEKLDVLRKEGFKILLSPGNHDYGWNGVIANKQNMRNNFSKLLEKDWQSQFEVNDGKFPLTYEHQIDGGNILLIALDSMEAEAEGMRSLFAQGKIGNEQLGKLKGVLDDEKYDNHIKIVMLHHHPFDRKIAHHLKDSDEFMETVKNKVDILLFGHKHIEDDFSSDKVDLILASGKSTKRYKKHLNCLVFREITINYDEKGRPAFYYRIIPIP